MTVIAYTDASHCHITGVSACGFVVLVDGHIIKHEVLLIHGLDGSQAAELYSIVHAPQYCFMLDGVRSIRLKTDCQTVVNRVKRKKKYQELNDTIEMIQEYGIFVSVSFVKSHSKCEMNNLVDNSSRKQLREYLKTNK
jgi:ribonuclease HI